MLFSRTLTGHEARMLRKKVNAAFCREQAV